MFIEKDRRRIDQILIDSNDKKDKLYLSKRSPEFNGSLRILCIESNLPSLMNLRELNLYDNNLQDLTGIGLLSVAAVESINLGANKLKNIPEEFSELRSLKSLWLDDNLLEEFPLSLCSLSKLSTLRITGNSIKQIPDEICLLENLETLALDNNEITTLSSSFFNLKKLKNLWLRQNKLKELSSNVANLKELQILSVSSNQLEFLPEELSNCENLTKIYANSNKISKVPSLLVNTKVKEINLSNNLLSSIPEEWIASWGEYDSSSHKLKNQEACTVILIDNTI